jgi:transglutaminase-like putative cysteine protease
VENVRSIYDFVRREITYQTVPGEGPKYCLETLADGTGDCDDQSILFLSLCRAIGIPSWLAFGGLYDPTTNTWGSHAWAEVCIPLTDNTWENVTYDLANGEYMLRNCNRFEEWKSTGEKNATRDYYYLFSHIPTGHYPHLTVDLDESFSGVYTPSSESIGTGAMLLNENEKTINGVCLYHRQCSWISPRS